MLISDGETLHKMWRDNEIYNHAKGFCNGILTLLLTILVILWQTVLLISETGVLGENQRPAGIN